MELEPVQLVRIWHLRISSGCNSLLAQIRSNYEIISFFVDIGAIGAVSILAVLLLNAVSAVFRR
jgi:hypothetical protein